MILDEQMRQSKYVAFREFLSRARFGAFTEQNLAFLNSKVITSLVDPELDGVPVIVKRNRLRREEVDICLQQKNEASRYRSKLGRNGS
jgi:hypothetical protein